MSTVKVNLPAINRFFERSPLAGAGAPGLKSGQATRVAARMVAFVRAEIEATYNTRTSTLVDSLHPIIRPDPRGGVRVGVGSTAEHSEYLTKGTPAHPIPLSPSPYSLRSNGPRSKGPNPTPLTRWPIYQVNHPGNRANDFIRKGVNAAIGRPVP